VPVENLYTIPLRRRKRSLVSFLTTGIMVGSLSYSSPPTAPNDNVACRGRFAGTTGPELTSIASPCGGALELVEPFGLPGFLFSSAAGAGVAIT
jgi:hypothetical protein